MDLMDAIIKRRSIRQYADKPVEDEKITEILKAAMYAPSARNYQSWHFVVCNKREILDEIPNVHPYAEMAKQATAAILVCGDLTIEPSVEYNAVNCSAATQNILLSAHNLGLGSVWLGVYPRKERMEGLTKLFNLPEDIIPVSLVMLGYPNEMKSTPERFRQDRVHLNEW
jgi:nitroreductase